jgi:hypothetical protein
MRSEHILLAIHYLKKDRGGIEPNGKRRWALSGRQVGAKWRNFVSMWCSRDGPFSCKVGSPFSMVKASCTMKPMHVSYPLNNGEQWTSVFVLPFISVTNVSYPCRQLPKAGITVKMDPHVVSRPCASCCCRWILT